MLRIYVSRRVLRTTTAGTIQPWVGHQLRGLVGARLKGRSCRYSLQEQQSTWRYCRGCPHMRGCAYGETYEADPPAEAVLEGQEDGVRPIAVAPSFGLPEWVEPGHGVPVRAVFVGERAARHAAELWRVMAMAGERAGIGDGRVRYVVERGIEADEWQELPLPVAADSLGLVVPVVRVELLTPLMLKSQGRMVWRPRFGELLRGGLRVLGALLRYQGEAEGIDFAGLRMAGEAVERRRTWYQRFEQRHLSRRSGQERALVGVVGGGEYGPVPAALVRWLAAAGKVHVGQDRVAGAGGWRVWWQANAEVPGDWHLVE